MTVLELSKEADFEPIVIADGDREILGGYVGDLLSWVMGRAKSGDVWVTIMSNTNVIAVASLADVCCVIFSEGVTPEEEIIILAKEKGINLLCSELPTYETAKKLFRCLNE